MYYKLQIYIPWIKEYNKKSREEARLLKPLQTSSESCELASALQESLPWERAVSSVEADNGSQVASPSDLHLETMASAQTCELGGNFSL